MKIINHFLADDNGVKVPFKPTPNHGGIFTPQYLIIHYTASNNAEGAIEWMLSPKSKVSSHLHIDRKGNIVQLAPFNIVCWHAGKSVWRNVVGLNDYSIGIELQNTGTQEYTTKQIKAATEVAKALVKKYKLQDIMGHSDISPGRKFDPGDQFPMALFKVNSGLIGSYHKVKFMYTTSDVNLREAGGINFKVITVIPKKTEVNIIEEGSEWVKVLICDSKLHGWVNKKYLI